MTVYKYHTLERSNYFSVEDKEAFAKEMEMAGIKWWPGNRPDNAYKVAVAADPEKGGSFPVLVNNPDTNEEEAFDIRTASRKHRAGYDTAGLVGSMSQGSSYVDGWACIITRKYEPRNMTLSQRVSDTLNKMDIIATEFIN